MNNITKLGFYLAFVILAAWAVNADADYCAKSLCPTGTEHIACNHNMKFSQQCSKDAKIVEFTQELKDLVLEQFNRKRNFIAGGGKKGLPTACQMGTMQWNDDLAKLAELNVKKCRVENDECHNTEEFPYSGQNIAMLSFYDTADDKKMIMEAVAAWNEQMSEVKLGDVISIKKPNDRLPTIGHALAMIADRNTLVGCSASTFAVDSKNYSHYLITCNFALTNLIGAPLYERCPKIGSKCELKSKQYENLCDTQQKYQHNGHPEK